MLLTLLTDWNPTEQSVADARIEQAIPQPDTTSLELGGKGDECL